jgi:hypothetical protein
MALGTEFAFSEFTSDQGVTYKLSIYDSTSAVGTTEFTCAGDGFVLTYKGEGDERYEPIKASSVKFQMNVTSISSPLYAIPNNLQSSEQGRYKLKIQRSTNLGVTYADFWHGVIIPDIAQFEDVSFPAFYKFTAVDGLSLMKKIPFDRDVYQNPTDKDDIKTFATILTNMLDYYTGGMSDFFGASDTFVRELTHWYEDTMPTAAAGISPIKYSATYPYAFVDIQYNEEGEIVKEKPISAYKVLEAILKAWGCRIWQQDGHWWMAHINMWSDLPTMNLYYRRLDTAGGVLGSGTSAEADFQKELGSISDGYDITKLSGSVYSFMPDIHEVTASYSNWTSAGMLGTEQQLVEYAGATPALALAQAESDLQNLGYVIASSGAAIDITHRVQARFNQSGTPDLDWYDQLGLVYMLKIGTNYWNGSTWTTTQSVYQAPPLSTATTLSGAGEDDYVPFGPYPQVSFLTDDIPVSGNLYYSVYKSQTNFLVTIDPIGDHNDYEAKIIANTTSSPSRVMFVINSSEVIERTFSSADTSSLANEILDLEEMLVGDGPTAGPPSWGRIRVSSDLVTWESDIEEDWQAWETGTTSRITQILTEQCLIGQREFLPLNNYNFILRNAAAFRFGDALDDNTQGGNRMVPNGWVLNANQDEVSGEFFKASQDISGITNTNVNTDQQADEGGWWNLGL